MIRQVVTSLAVLVLAGPCVAQDVFDDASATQSRLAADVALALALGEGDAVFAARLDGGISHVLASGLEIGLAGIVAVQADAPSRPGFTADFTADTSAANGLRGAFSGLARGPAGPASTGPRAQVEAVYLFASGGYGEARIGFDSGVADRFFEGGPELFTAASLANPALDPAGAAYIRTDHDLTGPAAKASFSTPRLLGVRAGLSLTPQADRRGLDRDPVRSVRGIDAPQIENAVEAAINVSRRLPQSGVRLRAALAYSRADAGSSLRPGAYGAVETWSGGGSAGLGNLEIGASALSSTNGIAGHPGDYNAWSVSALNRFALFDAGVSLGAAEDDLTGLESQAWSVGIARKVTESVRIAGGWRDQETRLARLPPGNAGAAREAAQGVVIEITLSR